MRPIDRSLLPIFAGEQAEHVGRIRTLLKSIATAEGCVDGGALEELQRRAHTLKGAAHAVGLEATETLVHRLESAFVKIRDGIAAPTSEVSALVERCLEAVEDILAAAQIEKNRPPIDDLLLALQQFPATAPAPVKRSSEAPTAEPAPQQPPTDSDFVRVRAQLIDNVG